MHMADALVTPMVAGTMYTCSAVAAIYSVKKLQKEGDNKKIPIMGVMGAFIFAAQMINFTIPGTGSSGHLCGGMMLTALLGPFGAFLTMIGVLLIQCLMFADGGILSLGCNIWNMAFYGCFLGYFLIWLPIMKKCMSKRKIIIASILGCMFTLQLGAFSVVLETTASGITSLPFSAFLITMQPIHLAIGFIEGLITSAVLIFVYNIRPEMLQNNNKHRENEFSLKKIMTVFLVLTVIVGGGLSLLASSSPDGLEWSILKITGSTEAEGKSEKVHTSAKEVQDKTAILPDYSFKDNEGATGTAFSGVIGAIVVLIVCGSMCYIITNNKRKKETKYE